VRLIVPRRGGWRAWGAVRADFERALADPADPAIATAEIASELRRGADYVRVTIAFTILATDVADALAIGWDAFRSAARDDLAGWEVTAATAEVQPEPPLIRAGCHAAAPGFDVALAISSCKNACILRSRERGWPFVAIHRREPLPGPWPLLADKFEAVRCQ
jgi:hypothetical protein